MLHPIIAARRAFLAGAGAAPATVPAGVEAASESAAISRTATSSPSLFSAAKKS